MAESVDGIGAASPSERLAVEALGRLTEAGLVRDEARLDLAGKIATGRMTAADWRLELELAAQKAELT